MPLSKAPVVLVTVCVIISVFVHTTVVPAATDIEDGVNAILLTMTVSLAVTAGVLLLLLLHDVTAIIVVTVTRMLTKIFFIK